MISFLIKDSSYSNIKCVCVCVCILSKVNLKHARFQGDIYLYIDMDTLMESLSNRKWDSEPLLLPGIILNFIISTGITKPNRTL